MQDSSSAAVATAENAGEPASTTSESGRDDVVSTHVLVPEEKAHQLRELSRRTRVAQSEYLREAVDDLLGKYNKTPSEGEG